ncbi:MAG: hypothetical protein VB082_07345 [Christensenella sp.]|nr:hypothetical protein [Christensenella sp.]
MGRIFVKKRKRSVLWKVAVPVLCFAVVLMMICFGIANTSGSAGEEQLRMVERSVRRAVASCYAIEGSYPEDLDYLAEHYGLILDREHYIYSYRPVGANLMPEIFVFDA